MSKGKVSMTHLPLLCRKLQELNAQWEQFGSALHLDYDIIQEIKQNPVERTVRQKMTKVLVNWKMDNNKKTWRAVYDALKHVRNFELADRVHKLHPDLDSEVPVDDHDYVEKMLDLLQGVIRQWEIFGLHLGFHYDELQEINQGKLTSEDCMKEVIATWIRVKRDKATGDEIIEACRRVKNYYLAEKLDRDTEFKKAFGTVEVGEIKEKSQEIEKPTAKRVQPIDHSQLIRCIGAVIDGMYASLSSLFDDSLKKVAEEMLQAGIITRTMERNPTFDAIINSFLSAFEFMDELEDVEKHCVKFLSVFYKIGGPFVPAGDMIKKRLLKKADSELGIELKLNELNTII